MNIWLIHIIKSRTYLSFQLRDVVRKCVNSDPSKRPTAAEVVDILRQCDETINSTCTEETQWDQYANEDVI